MLSTKNFFVEKMRAIANFLCCSSNELRRILSRVQLIIRLARVFWSEALGTSLLFLKKNTRRVIETETVKVYARFRITKPFIRSYFNFR